MVLKIESKHKCPYCGYIYHSEFDKNIFAHLLSDPGGNYAVHSIIRVCPHIECGKTEIMVDAGSFPAVLKGKPDGERNKIRYNLPNTCFHRRLLPTEFGGNPEFKSAQVPEAIFRDYDEACKLLEISPCASATYARRCLQGMIRAKFKVKHGKLQNEINALANLSPPVHQEIIEALDYIRKQGRFRALPEDDVKVIQDLTDEAAKAILDIVEILLRDWFIAPAEHNGRLAILQLLVSRKTAER